MKNLQAVVIIVIVVLIGVFGFMWFNNKSEVGYTPPLIYTTPAVVGQSVEGCYVAMLAKDVYTLTISSEQNGTFTGKLSFKNFEKDSSSGTYTGAYKDGILLGDYSFDSEGMHSVMQVIFKKSGNDFVRGYGDVDSTGTRFTDLSKITYDTNAVFKPSSCSPTATDTSSWKTFSDSKITFKYPAGIPTQYINVVDWPPKAQITSSAFSCTPAGSETAQAGQTTRQTINGRDYCVTKEIEGAAGSTYTQYAYATEIQNKLVTLSFSLRSVQCGNYSDPQKTACEQERSAFSINPTLDQIAQTVVLK